MTVPEANVPRGGVPVIWGYVPARNKNFTGRDDILERLREGASSRVTAVLPESGRQSSESDGNPIPQGVHGLGGVGKTAIAIEYVYRFSSHYDLVWWIAADQLPSVRGSLAELAQRLGLEASPTAGVDGLIAAVRDALRRGEPYRRWLIVFDNADQPEDIKDLIPTGPGDVLITSRNHRWESVIRTVPMDVFRPQESRDFLLKRVRKGLTEADAERLARELGHLPLALDQAGAMLAETGMPADEYLRLLKEHAAEIMNEGPPSGYGHTMTAAWKLSVDAVKRSRPQALEVLRCCAFFGPEPIPRDVFRRGAQETGSPVAEVLSNPIATASVMRELARYALITLDGNAVKVHRLIQALVRDELSPEQRRAYRHEAQLIMAAAAPTNPDDATTWRRFQDLLPHANAEATELHLSREFAVRDLARGVIRYLYQSGDYTSALALTERFIEQWTADSGPDDENVLRAQRHLANIQRLMGRYADAYRTTEDSLARARVTLGEDDPTTLTLRTGLGADLRASGSFAAARELDTESLTLLERKYGAKDGRTLRLLSSLALDHGLMSDYSTAQELYERAFGEMRRADSTPALDVIGAWFGISWTLRLRGKFEDALDVAQDARDYGQSSSGLGADHLYTLRAVNAYLIASRRVTEKRLDAIEESREVLDLATRRHGERNPDTLAIAIALSNLLRATDVAYHEQALELATATLDRFVGVYGNKHPYYYGCLTNLALLKRATGDAVVARELNEEALRGLTDALGQNHHYTLTAAMNLASDLAALDRLADARAMGEETLKRLSEQLGTIHAHTLGCAANLSLDMIALGDEKDGNELRSKTLRLLADTYRTDSPDYIAAASRDRLDPDFDPPAI
ncbi:MAG TPA: FxSxx-COOH system tetratricopeptide repeat protein [Trebonia sp.]|nr:FxSxx-COOH system tetratricopeptide repeat protein [Trebonia sp.]